MRNGSKFNIRQLRQRPGDLASVPLSPNQPYSYAAREPHCGGCGRECAGTGQQRASTNTHAIQDTAASSSKLPVLEASG